ncbi:hypothetical protein FACS189449_05750 [Alphaproteobacteria bacterium]|nr:hypothetical protein FACS189449_05750 [Alphaproteobacteria bacterium]
MLESENDSFIEYFGFREKDIRLLRLMFADNTTENDVLDILSQYDIFDEFLGVNLLLAFLVNRHPGIKHPLVPVLQGVVRYFQYKNAFLLEGFWKIGKELNRRGIPILIIKGLVMRHLYPRYLRHMYDVDFVVPRRRIDEAVEIATEMGATIVIKTLHSVDMIFSDNMKFDIHSVVIKEDSSVDDKIWRSSRRDVAFGVKVLIPSTENLIFSVLTNFYCNLIYDDFFWDTSKHTVSAKSLAWICDIVNILKTNKSINWNIIMENGEKTGLTYQIKQLLDVFKSILPGMLPNTYDIESKKFNPESAEKKIKRDKKIIKLFQLRDKLLRASVTELAASAQMTSPTSDSAKINACAASADVNADAST